MSLRPARGQREELFRSAYFAGLVEALHRLLNHTVDKALKVCRAILRVCLKCATEFPADSASASSVNVAFMPQPSGRRSEVKGDTSEYSDGAQCQGPAVSKAHVRGWE
jgi:hypothetical protein